jgi:hypothetical protein
MADLVIPDAATFASLPLALACHVFLALPADARGRASCVCRAWRDVLAEPSLWTRLVLSVKGVEWQRLLRVLHGAAGRARGQLHLLVLAHSDVALNDLLPVLTAYGGSLRVLHLNTVHENEQHGSTVAAVMRAAPLLQVLTVESVSCMWEDALRMLRSEPPFALLKVLYAVIVGFSRDDRSVGGMERFAPFAAALADAAVQQTLNLVCVVSADTSQPALMGALADAAVARRLRVLFLQNCTPPAPAPLARLLVEGSLTVLQFSRTHAPGTPLFDAAGAALVADALRVNTTLTKLKLLGAELCVDMRVACTLLCALVRHPSLRELRITGEKISMENRGAFGAAFGALIAADAPALHVLDCSSNLLEDVGLAPTVEALALNRHLQELNVSDNGISEAFAREQLLTALRANTTLRAL